MLIHTLSLFRKIFVLGFYRDNAFLLFILSGIAFGFAGRAEHVALAEFLVSSPLLLLIPISFWLVYTIHVSKFNRSLLRRQENEFLFSASLLSRRHKLATLFITIFFQLLPIVLYGQFLVSVAIHHAFFVSLFLVKGSLAFLLFAGVYDIQNHLINPNQERRLGKLTRLINTNITKPSFLFSIEWIVRREPIIFFGAKIVSLLILIGVTQLYKTDVYDIRLLAMGLVIALASQLNLVWEIHRFDNFYLSINRQLPISRIKRMLLFAATVFFLLFPELALLTKNFPEQLSDWHLIEVFGFVMSFTILFYSFLYSKALKQEDILVLVFFLAIGFILAILFKVPLWLFTILNVAVSLHYIRKYYYSFE